MQKKRLAFDQLYDIRAVRVMVDDVAACYAALVKTLCVAERAQRRCGCVSGEGADRILPIPADARSIKTVKDRLESSTQLDELHKTG